MTDERARVTLFEGAGRARVAIGDSTWDDVPVLPLQADGVEPSSLPPRAVVLRAGEARAWVVDGDARVEADLLYASDRDATASGVRVREVRERPAAEPKRGLRGLFGRKG